MRATDRKKESIHEYNDFVNLYLISMAELKHYSFVTFYQWSENSSEIATCAGWELITYRLMGIDVR